MNVARDFFGFQAPIREGSARETDLVCSGGFMSICAAGNIGRAIQVFLELSATSNGNEAFGHTVLPAFSGYAWIFICPGRLLLRCHPGV